MRLSGGVPKPVVVTFPDGVEQEFKSQSAAHNALYDRGILMELAYISMACRGKTVPKRFSEMGVKVRFKDPDQI